MQIKCNLKLKNIVKKIYMIFLSLLIMLTSYPLDLALAVQTNTNLVKNNKSHYRHKVNAKTKYKSKLLKSSKAIQSIQNVPKSVAKSLVSIFTPQIRLGLNPSNKDITNARVFVEPIIPIGSLHTNPNENKDLGKALSVYFNDENPKPLENFISQYPHSKWNASIKYNLAVKYFNERYLSKALTYFNQAYLASRNDKSQAGIHLANAAIANLMELEARLGMLTILETQVKEIKGRSFAGVLETKITNAKDGLWTMQHHPEIAFKCGPYAVNNLYNLTQSKNTNHQINAIVKAMPSTIKGTNLLQLNQLAKKLGLNYQMAKREPNGQFITPCVMHWKVNHFAAIVKYKNGWYQIKDPTFGDNYNAWVKSDVLKAETDGYFLIPNNSTQAKSVAQALQNTVTTNSSTSPSQNGTITLSLPQGWQAVSNTQASSVWGKGVSQGRDPAKTPTNPKQCPNNNCPPCSGMAKASAFSMQASLNITDIPLSYKPPIGQNMDFLLNYNYLETGQPSAFSFPTFGSNWSLNYIAYLTLIGNNEIQVNIPGGGVEDYQYTEPITNIGDNLGYNLTSQATLVKTGANSYNRLLPDGSIESYKQPTGTGIILLTQISSPQGNTVTIQYDTNFRITGIIDAINQQSSLTYASNTFGASGYYNIIAITDPFGRSAKFTYDSTLNFLTSITDANGMISSFYYDESNDFITQMTTPYGSTVFNMFSPPGGIYPATGLQFTFPDNTRCVIENFITETKQTYFFDREVMAKYPTFATNQNFTHCKLTKWLFNSNTNNEEPVINYEQMPLESPTIYSYEGEQGNDIIGLSNQPTQISRPIINNIAIATFNGNLLNAGDTVILSVINPALANDNIESVSYVASQNDTYITMANYLANAINSDTNLQAIGVSAFANGNSIILNSLSANPTRYTSFVNLGSFTQVNIPQFSEPLNISITNMPYQTNIAVVTGTITANDVITLTVNNPNLPNGTLNLNYTVQSSDTLVSIVSNLTNLINSTTTLTNAKITASTNTNSNYKYLNLYSAISNSTFTANLNSGATENVTVGFSPYQLTGGNISGNITAGDTITINVTNSGLSPYSQTVIPINYTVVSGDTLTTIASSIANLINTNASLRTQGVSAIYPVLGLNNNTVFGLNSVTGNIINYTYSTNSLASETISLGLSNINNAQVWNYQYNDFGHVIQSIDPVGRSFNYLYDASLVDLLEIREVQNGDNYLIGKWEYTTNQHIPSAFINGSAQVTRYGYNGYGQLTSLTDALGAVTTFNYYNPYPGNPNIPAVFLNTIVGPLAGNLDISTLTYDIYNRIQTITNSEFYTLTLAYDNLNRITLITHPDGSTQQNIYDRLDAVQVKDRLGHWTVNNYDSMDELVKSVDPLGRQTLYTWCNCGSLATITDGNGNTTTLHHDLEGRVISKTYADNSQYTYAYDSISRLQTQTDALKQVSNYIYNPDDSMAQIIYTNPANANILANSYMVYDPKFNRLTSATNAWGKLNYTYNPYVTDPFGTATTGGGKVASETNTVIPNSTIAYTYDALNRVLSRSINGSSNATSYTYDQIGRITNELNNLGNFGYNYIDNVNGYSRGSMKLQSVTYPHNVITANFNYYGQIDDNRLANIVNLSAPGLPPAVAVADSATTVAGLAKTVVNSAKITVKDTKSLVKSFPFPNGNTLSNFTYAYDALGNITNWQQQQYGQNNNINTYNYDNGNELISATSNYVNSSPPNLNINNFNYDKAYNMTSKQNSAYEIATIGGSITAGDTITIDVNSNSINGNPASITYTVQSGDTLNSIASNMASLLNQRLNNFGYQSLYAYANNNVINMSYTYSSSVTFSSFISAGATETLTLGNQQNSIMNIGIGGTLTVNDLLTITINDKGLPGGSVALNYTVQSGDTLNSIASNYTGLINSNSSLTALGITASVYNNSNTIQVTSTSSNITTYTRNRSGGATENIIFSINQNGINNLNISGVAKANDTINVNIFDKGLSNGSLSLTYTVSSTDTLNTIASNIANLINNNATLQGLGVSSNVIPTSSVVVLKSTSINPTTYRANTNSGASEYIVASLNTNGTNVVTFSGSAQTGQTVTLQVFDSNFSGGPVTLTYTIQSSDTLSTIASNVASLVNSNSVLQANGVTATSNSTSLYLKSVSSSTTTYTISQSNPTELFLNISSGILNTSYDINNLNQVTNLSIYGNVPVTGKSNKALKAVTINGNNANLNYSQKFTGAVVPNSDLEHITITATDGANNQLTNNYYAPIVANSQGQAVVSYDANGNTLSDNLHNIYNYDTQDRLVQSINGNGGISNFTYDAFGHCVKITESSNGIITSVKQFIWCGNQRCEVRDVNGSLLNQYFNYGQINYSGSIGTNYFYTLDHLGSIRELVDISGNIHAQYSYSAFGEVTATGSNGMAPSVNSDFQYAGYYYHQPSGLNLTMYRGYNASLHRWLTRDPLGESAGINLYGYVMNDPLSLIDIFGLQFATIEEAGNFGASYARTATQLSGNQSEYGGYIYLGNDGLFHSTGLTQGEPGTGIVQLNNLTGPFGSSIAGDFHSHTTPFRQNKCRKPILNSNNSPPIVGQPFYGSGWNVNDKPSDNSTGNNFSGQDMQVIWALQRQGFLGAPNGMNFNYNGQIYNFTPNFSTLEPPPSITL